MEQPTHPSTTPPQNTPLLIPITISVILTALIVGSGVYWWSNQKQIALNDEIDSLRTQLQGAPQVTPPTPTTDSVTQSNLESVFELDHKAIGTKIYYSEKLGVGFTYLSYSPDSPVTITESDRGIDINGQSIEVFTKDPTLTLAETLESKFLQEYSPDDCFVKTYETTEQALVGYVSAGISFPATSDPEAPWWENSEKCPQYYSETNGIQYFLMNQAVPNKFLFIRIGQESTVSDGTPQTADGGFNWSHSLRILK